MVQIPPRTSVTIRDEKLKGWLKEQIEKQRFTSVNHACRYALMHVMREEART